MIREVTVSSSEGRPAQWHDTIKEDGRRLTGVPHNADAALSKYNEHWIGEYKTDGEKFDEVFQSTVDEFNSRQNRPAKRMGPTSSKPERQKTYYEGIVDGTWCNGTGDMQENAIYEAVLQMGNKDTLGTTDTDFDIKHWYELKDSGQEDEASKYAVEHLNQSAEMERSKRIIKRAVQRIQNLDPEHLVVIRADWHADEPNGTPNCHFAYILRGTGYKSGLKERCASVRALEQMGFSKSKEKGYGIEQLHERFKEIVAEEMEADAKEFGYEDDAFARAPDRGEHRKRSDVDVFREMAAERQDLEERKEVAKELFDDASDRIFQADAREAEVEKKNRDLQRKNTSLEVNNNLLQKSYDELDHEYDELEKKFEERKAENDGARQIIEESFRTVVRFMRGAGHEDDEVGVPETNVSIAEMLKAEMLAMQIRIQEQMARERQVMLDKMNNLVERLEKSADADESRKDFMLKTTDTRTGRTMEDIYQEGLAKKRKYKDGLVKEVEQMSGAKSGDEVQKE